MDSDAKEIAEEIANIVTGVDGDTIIVLTKAGGDGLAWLQWDNDDKAWALSTTPAAVLDQMRHPQSVARLMLEKERAVYWLCRVLAMIPDAGMPQLSRDLRAVLGELGYGDARIARMIDMGEPGKR